MNEQVSPVKEIKEQMVNRIKTEKKKEEKIIIIKKCRVGFSSLFDLWLSKTMPKNISYEKKPS